MDLNAPPSPAIGEVPRFMDSPAVPQTDPPAALASSPQEPSTPIATRENNPLPGPALQAGEGTSAAANAVGKALDIIVADVDTPGRADSNNEWMVAVGSDVGMPDVMNVDGGGVIDVEAGNEGGHSMRAGVDRHDVSDVAAGVAEAGMGAAYEAGTAAADAEDEDLLGFNETVDLMLGELKSEADLSGGTAGGAAGGMSGGTAGVENTTPTGAAPEVDMLDVSVDDDMTAAHDNSAAMNRVDVALTSGAAGVESNDDNGPVDIGVVVATDAGTGCEAKEGITNADDEAAAAMTNADAAADAVMTNADDTADAAVTNAGDAADAAITHADDDAEGGITTAGDDATTAMTHAGDEADSAITTATDGTHVAAGTGTQVSGRDKQEPVNTVDDLNPKEEHGNGQGTPEAVIGRRAGARPARTPTPSKTAAMHHEAGGLGVESQGRQKRARKTEPAQRIPTAEAAENVGVNGSRLAATMLLPPVNGAEEVQLPGGCRCTPAVHALLKSAPQPSQRSKARSSRGSKGAPSNRRINFRSIPHKWAASPKLARLLRDSIARLLDNPDELPAMKLNGKSEEEEEVLAEVMCEEAACLATIQGTWYTEEEFLSILEADPTRYQSAHALRNWQPGVTLYLDFSRHLFQPLHTLFQPASTDNPTNLELVEGEDTSSGVPYVALVAKKDLPANSVLSLPRNEVSYAAMTCVLQQQCAVLRQQAEELRAGWQRLHEVCLKETIPLPSWFQPRSNQLSAHKPHLTTIDKHDTQGQDSSTATAAPARDGEAQEPCWLSPGAAKVLSEWQPTGKPLWEQSVFVDGLELAPVDCGDFDGKALLKMLRQRLNSGAYRTPLAELRPVPPGHHMRRLKPGGEVMGAYATTALEKGDVVGLYPGEIMTEAEYDEAGERAQTQHLYGVEVAAFEQTLGVLLVDASKQSSALRDINHYQDLLGGGPSKSPNVEYVPVLDHERKTVHMVVVTKAAVEAGEELFIDYTSQYFELLVPGLLDERDALQQQVSNLRYDVDVVAMELHTAGADVQAVLAGGH